MVVHRDPGMPDGVDHELAHQQQRTLDEHRVMAFLRQPGGDGAASPGATLWDVSGRDRALILCTACRPLRLLGVGERPADAFDQPRRHVRVAHLGRRQALLEFERSAIVDKRAGFVPLGLLTRIALGTPAPQS
jgi:hypothetical protein